MNTPLLMAAALMGASSAAAQCPNNDSVGSIDFNSPTYIPAGAASYNNLVLDGIWSGGVVDPGRDCFSFDVGPGRTVDIDTDYDFSQVALYLHLYTTAGAFIQGTDPNDMTAFTSYTNTSASPQTVVLSIASALSPSGCGDYALFVRNQACPFDDTLENFDTCQSSYPLTDPNDIRYQRLAIVDGDDDWYDVTLQAGESLDFSIFFEHARADVDLEIVDLNGGNCGGPLLDSSTSTTNDEAIFYTNTTGAVQDIGIGVTFYGAGPGISCNDYELAYEITGPGPDDSFEDNDTICSTAAIDLGVYRDLIVKDADSDFYEFDVFEGERAKLAIDFAHADGDIDLRLWQIAAGCGSAVQVDSSTSITDYEEVEVTSTMPGFTAYVLEVLYYPTDGGMNDYDLTVGFSRAADVGEFVCAGVPNSTGLEGYVFGTGSVAAADNDLIITAIQLPLNSVGFFNASMGFGFVAGPAGSQGNLCIAGAPIGRFQGPGQVMSSGSNGTIALPVDLANLPQPNGAVAGVPGDTWYFQLWHRDSIGGSAVSNFSGALRVRLQ